MDVASTAVSTLAGLGYKTGSADGSGAAAGFWEPQGLSYSAPDAAHAQGRLFITDAANATIRQVDLASQTASTLAGTAGQIGSADGAGTAARFNNPESSVYVAPDATYAQGRLYIADNQNAAIRLMDLATNSISTIAGAAGQFGNVDAIGAAARFSGPKAVVYSPPDAAYLQGRLFISEPGNRTIRQLDLATGGVTTFAGQKGVVGGNDGVGTAAQFGGLLGLTYSPPDASHPQGQLFVSEGGYSTIRQIDIASASVSTPVGAAGQVGYADGIGAAARFNGVQGISFSPADGTYPQGRLFVADLNNNCIRQIDVATKAVTTVVGQAGKQGFVTGSLPGVLNGPVAVQATAYGLYITMQNGVVQALPLP
jgi:hypothetical protein